MKYLPLSIITIGLISLASCKCTSKCKARQTEEASAVTAIDSSNVDKQSYSLGSIMALDLIKNGFDSIEVKSFQKGFEDTFNKDSLLVEEDSTMVYVRAMAQAAGDRKKRNATSEGRAYLDSNKTKEGVITTPSGLQYKIINKGIGGFPVATDEVVVHYEGLLTNGETFDSSYKRGQPATFNLQGVIKGWTEGIQYINEGGEIELYVPYQLGYGERGHGQVIPPFATLVFKVKLLEIKKPVTPPAGHGPHDGHNH